MRFAPFALVLSLASASAFAEGPLRVKPPPVKGDAQVFISGPAGAYFIARPLKERYDELQKRVADLKAEVRAAKLGSAEARRRIDAVKGDLKALMVEIDATKVFLPGAKVRTRTETTTIPIAPDDLFLIDCERVEIQGWDGADVQCVLEKTILDDGTTDLEAEFAGITLESRKAPGSEIFKARRGVGDAEQRERSPFKAYFGATFPYVTVKGVGFDKANRMMHIILLNEKRQGAALSAFQRRAKLTLRVPKCRLVGVIGGLGRFKARDLEAPLIVSGQGTPEEGELYEATNLAGPLTAWDIPLHRIDGIRGDVEVVAAELYYRHKFSPTAVEASYRNVSGDLRVRFNRAELALAGIWGRIDVDNDFGDTVWLLDSTTAAGRAHRILSQSGDVEVRIGEGIPENIRLTGYSECGRMRIDPSLGSPGVGFFGTAEGDVVRRSWSMQTWEPLDRDGRKGGEMDPRRPADVLYDRPRTPGADVMSRAGAVRFVPAPKPEG